MKLRPWMIGVAALLLLAGVGAAAGGGNLGWWRATTQTSVPMTASASHPLHWDDTATIPNSRFSDGTSDNYVAAINTISKGTLPVANGANFAALAAGTNGQCLTAQSGQSTGLQWAACGTGSGYATVQDEGTGLTQRTIINFTGVGVACADNAGAGRTDCTISGGGGGSTVGLKGAYQGGSTSADNIIPLTSPLGPVVIRDNASPIGTLWEVQNSSGSATYAAVYTSGLLSGRLDALVSGPMYLGGTNANGINALAPFAVMPNAFASGAASAFKITAAADTGQTASTEINGALFDYSATRTWAAGAIATQREVLFKAPTYAFASASTITEAGTVVIDRAPVPGANATITNRYALWVQNGPARFDGGMSTSGGSSFDLTGSSGPFKTTTGVSTFAGFSNNFTSAVLTLSFDGSAASVSSAGTAAIRYNNTTKAIEKSENGGAWTAITGSGGGGSTVGLLGAYNGGAASTDNIIGETSTLGAVLVRDNSTPLAGTIFGVQNSAGTTKYLDITDNGTQAIKSSVTDSSSAVGVALDTVNSFTATGDKLVSFRSAGVEKASIDHAGNYNGSAVGYLYNPSDTTTSLNWPNGSNLWVNFGGVTKYQLQAASFLPWNDNSSGLGDAAHRWTGVYGVAVVGNNFQSVNQAVSWSTATPSALAPASGEQIIATLSTNVTSWSISTGGAREHIVVVFVQDATGSRTLSGAASNIKLASALTLSTGAGKRDTVAFDYDGTNWIEAFRSLNN